MPDSFDAIVTVKALLFGTVVTSKVLVVKSATAYPVAPPPGKVTLVKVNKSPTANPCADLLIVTLAGPFDEENVAPVIAVSKGLISYNAPSKYKNNPLFVP